MTVSIHYVIEKRIDHKWRICIRTRCVKVTKLRLKIQKCLTEGGSSHLGVDLNLLIIA